jgi:RNA polymerase sigma factor (sigma-70 family)
MSYAWARCCCRYRQEEAEDVLQEVYLRVLDGRARYAGRASVKTWLFGVIRRTAHEHTRRRWLRATLLERWQRREPESEPQTLPEQALGESERHQRLRTALATLSHRQQEVLHLVFYQDLTIEVSAELLGISLGSARTHFERGKARLREYLQEPPAP